MDTNTHRFLYKEETHKVIGCALEVLKTIGHDLLEKSYENALVVEFQLNQLKITARHVGSLLNFKHPKLQWERSIL
ncbi:hypothetical protein JWG39_00660 [Desulforhopalus vacuolatus]|uniref:GxxExxY protein n=1 Tax=Desulforhopalus vacuolatus TaxID=40414 RepID=UPI00196257DC|nr:GxxExxY protein [Desulforhopalus vacuolatus]MBM9518326.1 hypothetical protein [Desulforhopalus vacuolatus]